MKRMLIIAAILKVFWGSAPDQNGVYLGRKELIAGGSVKINYFVVRLKDGTVAFIEPEMIEKVKAVEERHG